MLNTELVKERRSRQLLENKFESLRGSAVIGLDDIARVPALAHKNMEKVKNYLNNTAELKY